MAVPAPTSVRGRIVRQIATELANLDLGGIPAQRVEQVFRDWRAPETEPDYPYICLLDPRVQKVHGNAGAPKTFVLCTLGIEVWVVADADDARDEPAAETMERVTSKVEDKLLEIGVPDSGSLKAISGFNWLHLSGNEFFEFTRGGNVAAARIDAQVQFVHRDTDTTIGR